MCLALLLGLATKEGLIQAEAALSAEPACHHAARLLRPGLLDSDKIGQPGKTRGGCRDIYVSYTDGQVKIYRPDLFRVLRNGAGVSDEAFLESIDVAQLHSLASDSKSGQAFWRSGDGKVVLKTIKHYECVNLRNIIDSYAIHVLEDHSCIAGVIGVFRVKLPHGKKVYMLACKNVYHDGMSFEDGGSWKNRVKYDLKGSQVGRVRAPASDVLKDLDLMRSRQLLHLGDASKIALLHALHRDVVFLSTHHFMDYSLLVEVEEYAPGLVRGMAARIQGFRLPTSIDDRWVGGLVAVSVPDFLIIRKCLMLHKPGYQSQLVYSALRVSVGVDKGV